MTIPRPRVVSSSALPIDVRPLLGPAVDYWEPEAGDLTRAELERRAASAEGLIVTLTQSVDAALLAGASRLRVVANFAVGYDNIDVAAATARGIVVTNTPDVLTVATAEFTWALLLAAARRIVEGDRLVRSGAWTGWSPTHHLGAELAGGRLGIIGMGRIGRAVARMARGFSMDVIYAGGNHAPDPGDRVDARPVFLAELLGQADVVSLHCRLTSQTRHLINAAALAQMKPSALVVNTARGACVDEAALAAALERGSIAGAALDVYEAEPRVHPGLLASERVVLAPHAGSATSRARTKMAQLCAQAVHDVLSGARPPNVVNPEVYR